MIAAWARYAEGIDEQGEAITVVDRLKDRLMAAAAAYEQDDLAFIRDREPFGDLADDERFANAYRTSLQALHERGARDAISVLIHG